MDTPSQDTASLVDPSTVSVLGVVGESPALPPEKKAKKEKTTSKAKKPVAASTTDDNIAKLDQKWSDRFNRLEALLMAKTFQPNFSFDVRVTPSHSPLHTWARTLNPFSSLPLKLLRTTLYRTDLYIDLHVYSALAQTLLL